MLEPWPIPYSILLAFVFICICQFVHSPHLIVSIVVLSYFSPRSDVCTKYQEASKIVNLALTGVVCQCVPGAKVIDLCQFGTTVINTQASKLYTKKVNGAQVERGVAFPVCVSVNEIVCNHSPLVSDELVCATCCWIASIMMPFSQPGSVAPSWPRSLVFTPSLLRRGRTASKDWHADQHVSKPRKVTKLHRRRGIGSYG